MQITIAGGCGDFGRSCFFVEGGRHAFIVDAGTSTDGLDRVPDLTAEQVARAEYLFITHSHRDHTGAIGYFESLGFAGSVLLTNQTYRQMKEKPRNTMILDSKRPNWNWNGISVSAGGGAAIVPVPCGTIFPVKGRNCSSRGITEAMTLFMSVIMRKGKRRMWLSLMQHIRVIVRGQICAGRFLIKYWNWCGWGNRFFFLCRISAGGFPSRHISVIKEVWRFPCIWLPGFMTNGCVWGGGNTSPAGKCLPFPMKRFPYGTEKRFMTMGFISLPMPSCHGRRAENSSTGILNFRCS